MPPHQKALTTLGEMLANIPGMLGFYPQDSLVGCVRKRGVSASTYSVRLLFEGGYRRYPTSRQIEIRQLAREES